MSQPQRAQYVVLSIQPAVNRTEHVHIGILVRTPDAWRAHLSHDLRKLRAMSPTANAEAIRDLEARLPVLLKDCQDWPCALQVLRAWGVMASDGRPGAMLYTDEHDYLRLVQDALRSQVLTPHEPEAADVMIGIAQRMQQQLQLLLDYCRARNLSIPDSLAHDAQQVLDEWRRALRHAPCVGRPGAD